PPRSVRTPRAFNAEAIPLRVAIPAARISLRMGSTLAAKRSARSSAAIASDHWCRLPPPPASQARAAHPGRPIDRTSPPFLGARAACSGHPFLALVRERLVPARANDSHSNDPAWPTPPILAKAKLLLMYLENVTVPFQVAGLSSRRH